MADWDIARAPPPSRKRNVSLAVVPILSHIDTRIRGMKEKVGSKVGVRGRPQKTDRPAPQRTANQRRTLGGSQRCLGHQGSGSGSLRPVRPGPAVGMEHAVGMERWAANQERCNAEGGQGHSGQVHCAALAIGSMSVTTAAGFMYIYYGLPTAPSH